MARLVLTGAELIDRDGIELIFTDPNDGAEWRARVRTVGPPVVFVPTPSNLNDPGGAPPGTKGPPVTAEHYGERKTQ